MLKELSQLHPWEYIWTFAAALDEVDTNPHDNCPCTNLHQSTAASQPPRFVRNDYFVTLAVQIIISLSSMVMIHYRMELVVDQPTSAALLTNLHCP